MDRHEAVVGDEVAGERVLASFLGYTDAAKEINAKAVIETAERI